MNKKCRKFSKLVWKWRYKTWVSWWDIDVRYFSGKEYAKIEGYKKRHASGSIATCHTDWRYLTACIDVNKSAIKDMNEEEIEYVVVHEIAHIFLNEMREKGIKHEERTATILARSFILCGGAK